MAVGRDIDEIDLLRGAEYSLLAALLGAAPGAELLARVAELKGDATPLGMAHIALADAARATNETDLGREYFNLFIGVGRGEFLPYGSYYQTGFLHERPLARVREDMATLGIERDGPSKEPEIISRSCAKSWLAWHRAYSRQMSISRHVSLIGIWLPGRLVSLLIWRSTRRQFFTNRLAVSAVPSWNSNKRLSSYRIKGRLKLVAKLNRRLVS